MKDFVSDGVTQKKKKKREHRNLNYTRTSIFALDLQKFCGNKDLVKSRLISNLNKLFTYFIGTNLSSLYLHIHKNRLEIS
jgi:hypothetical protein